MYGEMMSAFYQADKELFVDVYVIQFREDALRKAFLICLSLPILKNFFPSDNKAY